MEEEKGGVLHIIFIFIGVACLSLGAFIFFTDEKIELKEEPNYSNTAKDDTPGDNNKNVINQLSIVKNVDTTVTLKNGNEVKIRYYIDDETNNGSFTYDGKVSYETSIIELCDEFYLYNDSIISYCTTGSATSGHLYIVDTNGNASKVSTFDDDGNSFITESITLKNDKIVVNGMRISENSLLKIGDKEIYLCNEEEVKLNNISLDSPAYADYELNIVDDKAEFKLIEVTKTLQEFIDESCKSVE